MFVLLVHVVFNSEKSVCEKGCKIEAEKTAKNAGANFRFERCEKL